MPRRVALYNGDNNALEEVVVAARGKEGSGGGRVGRGLSPMTTSESNENKLAMAVELDHMYIGCSDTKASLEKDIEVQHLKNIILLHLDLIQQQADQLLAKEKQIKNLRDENDNLRAKLERLDRRVSLSLQKKATEAYTNTESQVDLVVSPKRNSEVEAPAFDEDNTLVATTPGSPHGRTPPTPTPNKVLSPPSKPVSPSTNTLSPSLKVQSPSSTKSLSPVGKCVSPGGGKARSPAGKAGSPASKPGSPSSHNELPNRSTDLANKITLPSSPLGPLEIKAELCSPNKPGSPSSKLISPKQLSPTSKAVSPASIGSYLSNRVSSPPNKSGSPANKPPGEPASPPHKVVSPVSRLSPSQNKMGLVNSHGRLETLRKTSPKIVSPKTSPRERYPRGEANNDTNLTDGESFAEAAPDPLRKESLRSTDRRYGPKRRLESESEGETAAKKTRNDESADPTDHNLRSRDKPKEKSKEPVAQSSPSLVLDRPCTPTSRAAALETKKLRQKLLLKGQPLTGRSVRADGILNTGIAYYLPYGSLRHDPNPEEECLQSQVEIPQWGTRVLTSLYVMEGTENLEDEVFLKRHAKPEQDEKRRKRWDLQRMREQRHYERLRERYEGRQNTSEPEVSAGYRSLWPNPESALYLLVDDCLPVCAFGQPMARIPPQEFSLPWLSGRSQEGISTRRRKRP